jgi:hypothetical protein
MRYVKLTDNIDAALDAQFGDESRHTAEHNSV